MTIIVYKTTDINTGKIYIGVDTKNNPEYFGSGNLIKNIIKKRGTDSLIKETLFEFDNKEEAYLKEKEIVNKEFIKRPDVMNLNVGGFGGWDYTNESGSAAIAAGTVWVNKDNISKRIKKNLLESYIKNGYKVGRYSNKMYWINKSEKIKFIDKSELNSYVSKGWNIGLGHGTTTGKIWVYNKETKIRKNILPTELIYYLESGWIKGTGEAGMVFINKPGESSRKIKKEELAAYLSNGWSRGIGKRT